MSVVKDQPSAGAALIHGSLATAATFAWYSVPDLVRCRKARVALKAGLATLIAANEVVYLRPTLEYVHDVFAGHRLVSEGDSSADIPVDLQGLESPFLGSAVVDAQDVPADCASRPNLGDLDEDVEHSAEPLPGLSRMPSPVALQVAGVVAGTVAVGAAVVATERWLFSRGERRLSSGIPYAHTRQAAGVSALTAGLCALDFAVQYFFDSEPGE